MSEPMTLLDYMEAKRLLDKYGIESIESRYVASAKEAVSFAKGSRIVMKVLSDKQLHKSKAGLVKLDLETEKEISSAYNELYKKAQAVKPYKIIAQKMASEGNEIIIGGRTDPQFGKVVLIGLGGIYVEVFKDFALRVAPITRRDADEMLNQLKSQRIVTHEGKHTKLIVSLLLKIAKLMQENDSVSELDLNPVIVTDKGYEIVDIRILK